MYGTAFAAEGARVVVTGRNAERGAAAVAAITGAGGDAAFHAADLSDEAACAQLVSATVERFGGVTVLVNNAVGSTVDETDGPVAQLTTSSWEASLRVNLTAPMWLARTAIPHMVEAGHGSIVNISSRAAERASPGLAAYIASKGGLNALTRSIAVDYAERGVRCNTISRLRAERAATDLSGAVPASRACLTRLGEVTTRSAAVYPPPRSSSSRVGLPSTAAAAARA